MALGRHISPMVQAYWARGMSAARRRADLVAVADIGGVAGGVRKHFSEEQAFELTVVAS